MVKLADTPHLDELLTLAETALVLRVSRSTVHRLRTSGQLRTVQIGPGVIRVRAEDLARLTQPKA